MSFQPQNYRIQGVDLLGEGLKGFKAVSGIRQQLEQGQLARQAMQRKQEMQQDLVNFSKGAKTLSDYDTLFAKYPSLQAKLKAPYERASEVQKQGIVNRLQPIFGSIKSGNIDYAKTLIDQGIEAAQNSGDETELIKYQQWKKHLEQDPEIAKGTIGMVLKQVMEDEDFERMIEPTEQEKKKFGLDVIKEQREQRTQTLAEERFELEKDRKLSDLSDTVRKKGIELQAQGARPISKYSPDFLNSLPDSAFIEIGYGDDMMTFVKAPKAVGEAGGKLALIQTGMTDYKRILKSLESGKFTPGDIRMAATAGLKKLPRLQPIKNDLNKMVQGLARNLSGAAIGEDEMDSFIELFAIEKTDSDAEIKRKLQKAIDIAKKIENYTLYGATPEDQAELVRAELGEVEEQPQEDIPVPMRGATMVRDMPGEFAGFKLPFSEEGIQ